MTGTNVNDFYLFADDFLVSASLNALPLDAEFSASFTTGTPPTTIDFTDLSAGSPTSWSWTFGDGGTSTLQNPTHTRPPPFPPPRVLFTLGKSVAGTFYVTR